MAITAYTISKWSPGPQPSSENQIAASGGADSLNTSGIEADWRFHIQSCEIMYRRKSAYKFDDGTIDFNYIEANFTIECSREHIWTTVSSGDFFQPQLLELKSDSATGGLGLSGSIRTRQLGTLIRKVRRGDFESQERGNSTMIACRLPGAYNALFDTSATVNGTIFDIVEAAKAVDCPTFELAFLDL